MISFILPGTRCCAISVPSCSIAPSTVIAAPDSRREPRRRFPSTATVTAFSRKARSSTAETTRPIVETPRGTASAKASRAGSASRTRVSCGAAAAHCPVRPE